MKLSLRHNLTDDELTKALSGLVESAGIGEELVKALTKAACSCESPKEPKDKAMVPLFQLFRDEYRKAVLDIRRGISRITATQAMEKATAPSKPLTKDQVRRIQQAIRDRFELIAAQMQDDFEPAPEILLRWQQEGLISRDILPADFAATVAPEQRLIRNAFVFGRLHQALEVGRSYEEVLQLALGMPLKAPDLHAIAIAEQQTANYITALGDDLAKDAGGIFARFNRQMVQQMAIDYHGQRLTARVLDEQAKRDLGMPIPKKIVDTWQGFKSELHHAMDDKSRDWDRVAFYELHDVKSQGQAMQIMEELGPKKMVYKMPLPTACPQCKHLYLDEDGTPRLFPVDQMATWGNNVGRKPHPVKGGKVVPGGRGDGAETLKPVTGQIHPWCSCLGPYPYTGFEPWAEQKRQGPAGRPELAKAHIRSYTRADGTRVQEHDDSRKGKRLWELENGDHAIKSPLKVFGGHLDHSSRQASLDAEIENRMALIDLFGPKGKVLAGIETVRIKDLHSLQTTLSENKVRQRAKDFDEEKSAENHPVVFRLSDGTLVLKDGNHRAVGAMLAGKTHLTARVFDLPQSEKDEVLKAAPSKIPIGTYLIKKSHIRQYTRRDGTIVKEHEDNRSEHFHAGYERAKHHGKSKGSATEQEAYRKHLRKKGAVPTSAREDFRQGYEKRLAEQAPSKETSPVFSGPKPDLNYDPTREQIERQRRRNITGDPSIKIKLKTMAIADLTPTQEGEDRHNESSAETARIHREWNAGRMKESDIDYIGDFMPIVVDEKGTIIDGNHRYAAHESNGWKNIRVMQVAGTWEHDKKTGWHQVKRKEAPS
jgi:hypothetical protein